MAEAVFRAEFAFLSRWLPSALPHNGRRPLLARRCGDASHNFARLIPILRREKARRKNEGFSVKTSFSSAIVQTFSDVELSARLRQLGGKKQVGSGKNSCEVSSPLGVWQMVGWHGNSCLRFDRDRESCSDVFTFLDHYF